MGSSGICEWTDPKNPSALQLVSVSLSELVLSESLEARRWFHVCPTEDSCVVELCVLVDPRRGPRCENDAGYCAGATRAISLRAQQRQLSFRDEKIRAKGEDREAIP